MFVSTFKNKYWYIFLILKSVYPYELVINAHLMKRCFYSYIFVPQSYTQPDRQSFHSSRLCVFPNSLKAERMTIQSFLPSLMWETNCTRANKSDNHPIEWRVEAPQLSAYTLTYLPFCPLKPLLVFSRVCAVVYVWWCVSLWREHRRRRWRNKIKDGL